MMVKITSDNNLFITFGDRSYDKYENALAKEAQDKFGKGTFTEQSTVTEILKFGYDQVASIFVEIVHNYKELYFVFYLFENHEASIRLYLRGLNEDLMKSEGISENDLTLNRRILKLALEQTCDVDYSFKTDLPYPLPREVVNTYSKSVEDLLFIGNRLYAFSEHMAEQRMMQDGIEIEITDHELLVRRRHHYEYIYPMMGTLFKQGFKTGIMDEKIIHELREQLKVCMGIDYDFAGHQIFEIMKFHSPKVSTFQTIQPHVLIENLVQGNGVNREEATRFYHGLTLSRENKLDIKESVYQSGSMKRYFFRPILILNIDKEPRALVGEYKWRESITVMATNGFQWQLAPEEWLENPRFKTYLDEKSNAHDRLLEDEAMVSLKKKGIFHYHHATRLDHLQGDSVSIDHEQCGEIDLILIDSVAKKIILADCKYHRAKYEMVGFSGDFSKFKRGYEPKMTKKIGYIKERIGLVKEHFQKHYALPDIDLAEYTVEGLFIINTPTFYALNGKYATVTASTLEEFIDTGYVYLDAEIKNYPKQEEVKMIRHPYFTVQ